MAFVASYNSCCPYILDRGNTQGRDMDTRLCVKNESGPLKAISDMAVCQDTTCSGFVGGHTFQSRSSTSSCNACEIKEQPGCTLVVKGSGGQTVLCWGGTPCVGHEMVLLTRHQCLAFLISSD